MSLLMTTQTETVSCGVESLAQRKREIVKPPEMNAAKPARSHLAFVPPPPANVLPRTQQQTPLRSMITL